MESPLVHDYKKGFIYRRLLQTFFGGIKIWPITSTPIYFIIAQVFLYFAIPLILIAAIVTEQETRIFGSFLIYVVGGSYFAYFLLLHMISFVIYKKCTSSLQGQRGEEESALATDEEILEFDFFCGPKTCSLLCPEKRNFLSVIFSATVFGLLGGVGAYYLTSSSLMFQELNIVNGWYIAFLALSLFTITTAAWPLIGGPPPEPAVYKSLIPELTTLSRPLHIFTCIAVHILAWVNPDFFWLYVMDCIFHIIFVVLPLLWLAGVLPPVDAYVLWFVEQWNIVVLGCSESASTPRIFIQGIVGTFTLFTLTLIQDFTSILIIASCRGFLLSIDYVWAISSVLLSNNSVAHKKKHNSRRRLKYNKACIKEVSFYVPIFLVVTAAGLAIHLPTQQWYKKTTNSSQWEGRDELPEVPIVFQSSVISGFGNGVVGLTILHILLQIMQHAFFLNVLRNPFYSSMQKSSPKKVAGFFYQLIQVVGPLIMTTYLHLVFGLEAYKLQKDLPHSFIHLVHIVPLSWCYRYVWQNVTRALDSVSVFFLLEYLAQPDTLGLWPSLTPATRVYIVALTLIWVGRMFQKLKTFWMFTITAVSEHKQRKFANVILLVVNICLFPVILSVMVVSSIFCAPLLPLFTLPLFLVGFPRPYRFWPHPVGFSANHCTDSIYYEQLAPHVAISFHRLVQNGALGSVVPGKHFLLRWEDRLLWIQVLECGYLYNYYSVKGLELQETSCHSVEALKVDAVFSNAFSKEYDHKQSNLQHHYNPYYFHVLSPLTKLEALVYQDAKNVLTGVIDSPDVLNLIKVYFYKTVVYLLIDYVLKINVDELDPKVNTTTIKSTEEQVPISESVRNSRSSLASIEDISGRGSRLAWVDDLSVYKGSTEVAALGSKQSSFDKSDDPLGDRIPERSAKPDLKNRLSSLARNYVMPEVEDVETHHRLSDLIGGSEQDERSASENELQFVSMNSINIRPLQDSSKSINRDSLFSTISESPLSDILNPPRELFERLPFHADMLEENQSDFPHAWFKYLLQRFGMLYCKINKDMSESPILASLPGTATQMSASEKSRMMTPSEQIDVDMHRLLEDDNVEEAYRSLCSTFGLIVHGQEDEYLTPSQICSVFQGNFALSLGKNWLEENEHLKCLIIKALRISVKLALDHFLIGFSGTFTELIDSMKEYSNEWYIGPMTDTEYSSSLPSYLHPSNSCLSWSSSIRKEISNLFSLEFNETKGEYTSRMLTLGSEEINIGKLDEETVMSVWASLTTELLYFTNDDDERYSIQAHPLLLRNLTIQSADPPLGYPIYSSSALRFAAPWLGSHN